MSAVTGLPTQECARIMRTVTGKKVINGVSAETLIRALELAGYKASVTKYKIESSLTLRRWLENHDKNQVYILCVARHWIAYANGEIADSGFMFSRKPQPTKDAAHMRTRVKEMIDIHPA